MAMLAMLSVPTLKTRDKGILESTGTPKYFTNFLKLQIRVFDYEWPCQVVNGCNFKNY